MSRGCAQAEHGSHSADRLVQRCLADAFDQTENAELLLGLTPMAENDGGAGTGQLPDADEQAARLLRLLAAGASLVVDASSPVKPFSYGRVL